MLGIMLPALVAALLLLSLHAYLGIHIIARGVIFVDLAIAQMAALGWTAAVFVGFEAGSLSAYLVGLLYLSVAETGDAKVLLKPPGSDLYLYPLALLKYLSGDLSKHAGDLTLKLPYTGLLGIAPDNGH